jgi:hypothetical protein
MALEQHPHGCGRHRRLRDPRDAAAVESEAPAEVVTGHADPDARRRLVYAIVSERIKQHSASAQVFDDGNGRTRFVWTLDAESGLGGLYLGRITDPLVTLLFRRRVRWDLRRLKEALESSTEGSPTTS